jgi:hypothetical protein
MKNAALVIIMVAVALGSGVHRPASAQSAIGGVKKQNVLGGPVKQASPVVPVKKGGPVVSVNNAVPAPVNKPVPTVVAASTSAASAHVKCVAPCVARHPR